MATKTKKTAKKTVKKTAGKKKVTRAKAGKKTTAARKPAKAQAKNTKRKTAPGSNVLWKFLEAKEARRKQLAEQAQANKLTSTGSEKFHSRHDGFSRFAGPRRRAA